MLRVVMLVCSLGLAAIGATLSFSPSASRADFVYANSSDLNTLDPAQMSWTKDIRVAINLWEGLTSYDPRTAEPIEGAAEFPPRVSPDGLTYTFRLRPDGRWSNGDTVTAHDFVRGWRRAMEPGTARDYVGFFTDNLVGAREYYEWRNRGVKVLSALGRLADGSKPDEAGARALAEAGGIPPAGASGVDWREVHRRWLGRHAEEADERFVGVGLECPEPATLVVRLRRPCPYFAELCSFPTLFPIHAGIERLRERFDGAGLNRQGLFAYDPQWTKPDYRAAGYSGLVTNGPYRLREWSFKRRLRLVANEHYRVQAAPRAPTVDCVIYGDLSTAIMAYEAGDVDFLPEMQVDYDHRLIELGRSGQRPDFHNPAVLATHFYIFNCRAADVLDRRNPFSDARVRRAFSMVIDRKLLVENVLRRGDPVSGNLVPPGIGHGYEPPQPLERDPDAARRLLADAGYPGGQGLPVIDLLFPTTLNDEKTCEVLARMWETELGVRVELRGKEPKTFAEDKAQGRYMIARAGWYGDYRDPTTFLDVFRSHDGNNDAGYASDAYDGLLMDAEQQVDRAVRNGLLAEAERRLIREDCPVLPLHQRTNLMAVKPHVRGLWPNSRLIFPFRYISVTR